ncbi:MAG: FAD-dependent thymidylate synthase [Spirochaetes bacterium]|nr:FAD-dependent thymidylate synthase [Spirochaetota bacterium]
MKITLAGMNIDVDNIRLLKKYLEHPDDQILQQLQQLSWSPETLSASYARISRDPRDIDQLREEARKELKKAQKSNQSIIYDMGHSSIAEHAFFNFDIIGISRLASEELEKSRLVSFTEKSQRYIQIDTDYYIPQELKQDSELVTEYKDLTNSLFQSYQKFHEKLVPHFIKANPQIKPDTRDYRNLVNLAKEDARYILPLSTLSQLGMSINARNLEKLLRKLSASNLNELKQLAEQLFMQVQGLAPSLVKYTEATAFEKKTSLNLNQLINSLPASQHEDLPEVKLVQYKKDFEDDILIAMIIKRRFCNFDTAKKIIENLTAEQKKQLFQTAIENMESYDSLMREFEMTEFTFQICLSATAYAQLKRHRMASIIDSPYSINQNVTIPQSIIDCNLQDEFLKQIGKINHFYLVVKERFPHIVDYILSNSHRKNILLKCNFRELTHIIRLRSDQHAQWDIRRLSDFMVAEIKKISPFLHKILMGKSEFRKVIL